MAVLKIVALLAAVSVAFMAYHHVMNTSQTQNNELRELFNSWKVKYGKQYASAAEEAHRFQVFLENYALIMKHNSEGHSFWMAVNKFADLTNEEFGATYASGFGGVNVVDADGNDAHCPSAKNCPKLPDAEFQNVNWTAKGAVTPVKNQGQCGSCWAFSTTGALEGLYYLNKSLLVSFSEQQLVDCDKGCEACNGCFPYLALEYTASYGIEPEKIYPYTAQKQTCKYTQAAALKVNTGWQCVEQKSNSQLMAALLQQPVSIAVQANQPSWQFYGGGVVNNFCGDKLDHAVLLTGFGTHKNNPAWYVKNSWGSDWGNYGYIWIGNSSTANSGYGVCGILRCATLPVNNK